MGALPQSLDLDRLAGALPSPDSVRSTDFGLGQAGAEAGQVAELNERVQRVQQAAQMRADQQAVQPYVMQAREAAASNMATDSAKWDGTPGFGLDQYNKAKARNEVIADSAGDSLTPSQQAVLGHSLTMEASRAGDAAVAHEQATFQQNAAEAAATRRATALGQLQTVWGPVQQQLIDDNDGSQPGKLVGDTGTAFDAAAAPILQQASPVDKPALQASLAAMRTEAIARAAPIDAHSADAYTKTQVLSNTDQVISGVIAHPGTFAQAKVPLEAAIAAAPARLQPALRAEATDKLNQGYVEGLIQNDQLDLAHSALSSGQLNLKPEVEASLLARVNSAAKDRAPRNLAQASAQLNLQQRAAGAIDAIATTGQASADAPSVDDMAAAFGYPKAAEYQAQQTAAFQAHAVTGHVQAATTDELHAMAAAPMPNPQDPTYARDMPLWQATTRAAQQELASREKGAGAWAFSAGPAIKSGKGGAPQAMALQDHGAELQGMFQQISAAQTPQDRAQAATRFADRMLGVQESAGISKASWQIVPDQMAKSLAAGLRGAAPEQRLAAFAQVAQLVDAMPTSVKAQDGTLISPRALLARQLQAGGASLTDVSAIADYGSDPSRLGRYVAALNDPAAAKRLEKGPEQALTAAVASALAPVLQARSPLPGEDMFRQARTDRTTLIARYLVQSQGLTPQAAAQAAAGDLTQGEVMVNGQRMPAAVANAPVQPSIARLMSGQPLLQNRAYDIQAGQAKVVSDLLANNGARLFAPGATPGNSDQQRAQLALQASHAAKWVTSADGNTSTLMVPGRQGGYTPLADRFGKPITASWSQLQAQASGHAPPLFGDPGPGVLHTDAGQPVPAMSVSRATQVFQQALVGTESAGQNGAQSPKGALGRWQVMPQTAAPYAARIFGAPLDVNRLQNDPGYNQAIGQAVLGDAMRSFGGDPVLAAVAYNAGPGALTGYVNKAGQRHPGYLYTIGDPRTGQISHSDFIKRLPAGETQTYVGRLARRFAALAHAG